MSVIAAKLCNLKKDEIYKHLNKIKNVNGRLDLIKKFVELGIPNNQIFMAGQSCGGWATMMLISKYPGKVAGGISTHHACYGKLSKKYKVKKVGIEKALENFKKKRPGPAFLRENQIKEISNANIVDPKKENLNYDGTRALDGGDGAFRSGIKDGGKAKNASPIRLIFFGGL